MTQKNMNKIIVDEQVYSLNEFVGELQILSKECLLHLSGVNKITKLNLQEHSKITFHLTNDTQLLINDYWSNENNNVECIFDTDHNTKLDMELYLEASKDYKLVFKNNILGDNNKTKIAIHALTNDTGKIQIESSGFIEKNTQNNEFLEELKGLILKNQPITFLPNLLVDSDSVLANHNATIKCIDEEELFYLQSKGLSRKVAINLIKDGFLNKLK